MSNPIQVYIFQGGESIDSDNIAFVEHWTVEGVTNAFIEYHGPDWAESVDEYDDEEGPMKETVVIHGDNMASCIADADEGGMTYMVRINQG